MEDKENLQSGIEHELRQWYAQVESASQAIADLKEKANQLDRESRHQHLEQIQQLEEKISTAKVKIVEGQQRLDGYKAAGEEAWEEIKTGGQEAWETLKTSVDEASSKIKDRISNS